VHDAHAGDVVYGLDDRIEERLVEVVHVDAVSLFVEGAGQEDGLTDHEDVAEGAGGAVELAG
jgi:hypothetical protein